MDSTPAEKGYFLARNKAETERLNNQNPIFARMFGYHIHPSAAKILGSNARIADIATGTGIWLINLASEHPLFEFHGFDISSEQYPDAGEIPSNVKLHVQDAKKPFPAEWNETFDLIQIRFIISAMGDQDWKLVLDNVIAVLKPGAAFQWVEPDFMNTITAGPGDDGTQPVAHTEIFQRIHTASGISSRANIGARILPELFSAAGMQDVSTTVARPETPALRKDWSMNILQTMFYTLEVLAEKGIPGTGSMDDINKLRIEALEEHRKGCNYSLDMHVVIGFKPA